jgi:hypothetical protein
MLCSCVFVFDSYFYALICVFDIMCPQLGINATQAIIPTSVVGLIDGFKSMALGSVRRIVVALICVGVGGS